MGDYEEEKVAINNREKGDVEMKDEEEHMIRMPCCNKDYSWEGFRMRILLGCDDGNIFMVEGRKQ